MNGLKIATIAALFVFAGTGCAKTEKPMTENNQTPAVETTKPVETPVVPDAPIGKLAKVEAPATQMPKSDEVAILDIAGYGRIVLGFFPNKAPEHVKNFLNFAKQGYYDGSTFHRIIPGFMIQGGDPNSKDDDPNNDGMGGPPTRVKAEFNDLKHLPGTLSMARTQDPNSAGSQFFICHGAVPHLDGQYSIFGQVLSGMDVVDKIAKSPRGSNDNTFATNCPDRKKIAMKVTVAKWSDVVP
ncbi:MAG: peptidylprolyl isomerase [bacterium]|nr:peptidylprolyl isomerase [bacterium]